MLSAIGPIDRQWREVHDTVRGHFEHVVDHGVHGIAVPGQEVNGGPEQCFGAGKVDGREG